jgi:ribonuclease HII
MLEYVIESELIDKGYKYVCGVDEAGRGPLCGPVVAAACILPTGLVIDGLNDSKKLTEKKRDELFDLITENALAYSIAHSTVEEINDTNILDATLLAMRRAVEGLSVKADYLLIDGNICRGFDTPARAVIKGDATSPSIAAASILAKVTRDRMCIELDEKYPEYGIAKHKGYGTAAHYAALEKFGVPPIYRTKFLRSFYEKLESGGTFIKE